MGSSKKIGLRDVQVRKLLGGGVQITLGRTAAKVLRTIFNYVGGDPAGPRGIIDELNKKLDGISTGYLNEERFIHKKLYHEGYTGLYLVDKYRR